MWAVTQGYINSCELPIKEQLVVCQDLSPYTEEYLHLEIVSYQEIPILRSKVDASGSNNILLGLITFHNSSHQLIRSLFSILHSTSMLGFVFNKQIVIT